MIIPKHVAIIMDGNGRWGIKKNKSRNSGHEAGLVAAEKIIRETIKKKIKYLTLYAFSTENWHRSEREVNGLMQILQDALHNQTPILHANNVRIIHIGTEQNLTDKIRESINSAQELTKNNKGVTLNVAFDYGGRDEILEAVRSLIRAQIQPDQIDETLFSSHMYTHPSPDPDLVIRTGGELRVSNFLLWQSAYSEYYHTPTFWPDLNDSELELALKSYQSRDRRFGRVNAETE